MATEDAKADEPHNVLEEAHSWLKNPNLLENLVNDFGRCGVIGEPGNLVTVLLVFNSRLCLEPLNLSPSGDSGIGKSFLTSLPSEFWQHHAHVAGYMSKTSLIHDTDWAKKDPEGNYVVNLTGRVLILLEAESSRDFLNLMKPIRSHDKKQVWFNITEGEGKKRAKKVCMTGWPVFITISVNPSEKAEDSTRDLNLTPSYSEMKGRAVNLHKANVSATPWRYLTDGDLDELKAKWTQALCSLRRLKVINPFARELARNFDSKNPRSMRDFSKICSLFDSCALLHQCQRMVIKAKNGETYVIGTLDDLKITLEITNILLESTVTGLRADVLKAHKEFFHKSCPSGHGLTINEIMKAWHSHHGVTIKRSTLLGSYLYPLRDAGLMIQDDDEKTHRWEVSSVNVSAAVRMDSDRFFKVLDFESGLRHELTEVFASIGVSEVTRGENPISIASDEIIVQEILSSVQASTVRQMFIEKLNDPLASCLKNEDKITVGPPPTHPDTSTHHPIDTQCMDFGSRVDRALSMLEDGRSEDEIELSVGERVVEHCREKGLIPIIGGRKP